MEGGRMRRYVEGVLRLRFAEIGLVLLVSVVLGLQINDLHVVVDPNATLPQQHPYGAATREAERVFRRNHQLLIGITTRTGDVSTADVLAKIKRITDSLADLPGVEKGSVFSLARRAKNINGTA